LRVVRFICAVTLCAVAMPFQSHSQDNLFPSGWSGNPDGFCGIGPHGAMSFQKALHISASEPTMHEIGEPFIRLGWRTEGQNSSELYYSLFGMVTPRTTQIYTYATTQKPGDLIISNGYNSSQHNEKQDIMITSRNSKGKIRFTTKPDEQPPVWYDHQRMVIEPSGNIGIGTDNPSGRLDISFNQWAKNSGTPHHWLKIFPKIAFLSNDDYEPSINFIRATGSLTGCDPDKWKARSWKIKQAHYNVDQQWQTYGALNFQTVADESSDNVCVGDGDVIPDNLFATRMTLLTNGNVGIGEVNPQEKLHLNGTSFFNGNSTFRGVVTMQTSSSPFKNVTGTHSDYRLAVDGKVVAKELIITETDWADFVFEDNYHLPELRDVEQHIKTKKHLPGIPNAEEVKKDGISVGDIQAKLLQKIEELTLYIIQQEKRIADLENHSKGE